MTRTMGEVIAEGTPTLKSMFSYQRYTV